MGCPFVKILSEFYMLEKQALFVNNLFNILSVKYNQQVSL